MNQINSTKAVVTAVIFSISLLGMITKAEAHGGNNSATDIHACVRNRDGKTRIVSIDKDCKRKETATHWAITGPAGADGATGPAGPAGADGATGAVGADGPAGPAGPAGADGTNGTDGVDANQAQLDALQAQVDVLQALVDELHPPGFEIGDEGPAGGIVFQVTNGGLNGLEAASVDQTTEQWCSISTDIPNVDNIGFAAFPDSHSGADNTGLIEIVCGPNSAAGVAANYVWPNGQTDGFLPNKEELNLLFNQRDVVGGFANDVYWSSSENDANNAWLQNFINGEQGFVIKNAAFRVRAVRAF